MKRNTRDQSRDLSYVSRASGTNVSFNSSYSGIKNNIIKFKNKTKDSKGDMQIESALKNVVLTPIGKTSKNPALKKASITLDNVKKVQPPSQTPKI